MFPFKVVYKFIIISFAFSSCTFQGLIISNAEWLSMNRINNYFDLTNEQEDIFGPKVTLILKDIGGEFDHRNKSPENLGKFMRDLDAAWEDGLSSKDVEWLEYSYEKNKKRLAARYIPDAATFLTSLSSKQISHLEEKLEDSLKPRYELLEENLSDFKEEKTDQLEKSLETWYGSVNSEQLKKIAQITNFSKKGEKKSLDSLRARHKKFLSYLRSKKPRRDVEKFLLKISVDPSFLEPTESKQWLLDRRKNRWSLINKIDLLMSEKQRKHARDRVRYLSKSLVNLGK